MIQSPTKKLCFVIGPIGGEDSESRVHADWLLHGIIGPVLAEFTDFTVKRADKDHRPGLIDVQMIEDLLSAELVIADLTFLNPNAFYEIGIRHMTELPIIHMQMDNQERIPFDLSLYRAIKFSRARHSDIDRARASLKKAVEAVLHQGYKPDNPVINAKERIRLRKVMAEKTEAFAQEMDSIKEQVDGIREFLSDPKSNRGKIRYLEPPTPRKPGLWSLKIRASITASEEQLQEIRKRILLILPQALLRAIEKHHIQVTFETDSPVTRRLISSLATIPGVKEVYDVEEAPV